MKKTEKVLKPKKNTSFGGIIDKMTYGKLLLFIFLTIITFSVFYFLLNKIEAGTNQKNLSIYDALYFSVVTFATLGFGDIFPVGFSKFLVVIEVLLGLFLTAIFIGKVSSERQSTKLTLIYSSINHKRIMDFINDIFTIEKDMLKLYIQHDNSGLEILSKNAYDLVSVIRKYLTLHSLEGELASYGNSSSLRRLYLVLFKLQKTISDISKTFGISNKIVNVNNRTIKTIGDIGFRMKQFHYKNNKIIINLNELELEAERNIKNSSKLIYRTECNKELIEKINSFKSKYPNLIDNYKIIANEIGMSNKLCKKCVEKINNA